MHLIDNRPIGSTIKASTKGMSEINSIPYLRVKPKSEVKIINDHPAVKFITFFKDGKNIDPATLLNSLPQSLPSTT